MRFLSLIAFVASTVLYAVCPVAADSQVLLAAMDGNATDSSEAADWEGSLASDETPVPTPTADESLCDKTQDQMSVEGVEGVFCVKKGEGCAGDRAWGKCPGRQTGLPHGSYCGRVVTGVFGCKPGMPYGEVPDYGDLDRGDDESQSGSGSA